MPVGDLHVEAVEIIVAAGRVFPADLFGYRVVTAQTFARTDPKDTVPVFFYVVNSIGRQAGRIGKIASVSNEVNTIVPAQAIVGPQPNKTGVVLEDTFDIVIAQAIIGSDMREPHNRLRRSRKAGQQNDTGYDAVFFHSRKQQ
jgi:hypothetical protein